MKIAVITDDGKAVSRHFGRVGHYLVFSVDDGHIVGRDLRDKVGHTHFSNESHEERLPDAPHGTGPKAAGRHALMVQPIADCDVLISGGMVYGAYQSIQDAGIRPFVTDLIDIEQAVRAHLDGTLEDQVSRLH